MASLKLQSIKPKNMPKGKEYLQALEKSVQKTAGLVLRDLESTVKTWKHKPTFDVTITHTGNDYAITASTDDKPFVYVEAGTKPHIITPKRSKYLRFSSGYKAKTRPNVINSYPGGAFGSDIFAKSVRHPGFPGRHFTKAIASRRQKTLEQETSQAIAIIARKAE